MHIVERKEILSEVNVLQNNTLALLLIVLCCGCDGGLSSNNNQCLALLLIVLCCGGWQNGNAFGGQQIG